MIRRLIAAAVLWNIAAVAATREVECSWANLSALIVNKRIALVLPDGASVEGEVVEVRPDALAITIVRTSDAHANPKGAASIPRASVTTLQLLEMRPTGRIVGTVVGTAVGIGAAIGIALIGGLFSKETTAKTAGIVAVIVGVPVVGFFIGRSFDRKVTLIKVTR
jgi:hypothetical protein